MKKLDLLSLLLLPLITSCGSHIVSASGLAGVSSKYTVQLTWNEPGSADPAVSYNVYRELTTGPVGFAQINTSPVVATTYTDTQVQLGTSYSYVVRAVDAEGGESNVSNIATVQVPAK